nr:DNA-processing protein DprA [Mycoplasmopsis canis]WQQ12406.1 DNA processing protein [Mycoplasmopsis canis]
MNKTLFYFSNLHKGENYKIYTSIKNTDKVDENKMNELERKYEEIGIKFITMLDNEYPTTLLMNTKPPFVIYYKGNIDNLNHSNKVYLVNEIHNLDTQKNVRENISQLVKNTVLVTNGYKDTEREFIDEYRNLKGKIIHIAKSGIDDFNFKDFDFANEVVISQYPIETHARKYYFKSDNHLASIIADQLIYFSSSEKSKTHNLVNYFLDVGKDISCFPGTSIRDGNNKLIKSGAKLITYISETIAI